MSVLVKEADVTRMMSMLKVDPNQLEEQFLRWDEKQEDEKTVTPESTETGIMAKLLHMSPDESEEYWLHQEQEQAGRKAAPVALAAANNA